MAEDANGGANRLSDEAIRRVLSDMRRAVERQRFRERVMAYDAYLQAGAWPDLLDVPEPVRGRPGSPDTHRDHTMLDALLQTGRWAHLEARTMVAAERDWDSVRWEEYSPWRAQRERAAAMERVQRDKRRALGQPDGEGTGGDDGSDGGRAA